MPISVADQKFLEMLRKKGILQDVEGHKLKQSNGLTVVSCADADQVVDVFTYICQMQQAVRQEARPQMLSLNGGGLCLHPESPLNQELPKGEVLLNDIRGARVLKDIHTLAIYAHFPCGAARLSYFSAEEVFDWLVKGKRYIKERLTGVNVSCFIHVDWGNGRKRTYHFSAAAWDNRRSLLEKSFSLDFTPYTSSTGESLEQEHTCSGDDCSCNAPS
jgi:hypothetical protein